MYDVCIKSVMACQEIFLLISFFLCCNVSICSHFSFEKTPIRDVLFLISHILLSTLIVPAWALYGNSLMCSLDGCFSISMTYQPHSHRRMTVERPCQYDQRRNKNMRYQISYRCLPNRNMATYGNVAGEKE